MYDQNYVVVDLDAIEGNILAVKGKAGVPVMAVVKADAYGHGAVPVAKHLEKNVAFFGVSSMDEALELRTAGIEKPILILGHSMSDACPYAVAEDIRLSIFSLEDAKALSAEALRQGKTARFHYVVDTGMSRIGFQVTEEAADICAQIAQLPGLFAEGLFSHYATADCADLTRARKQGERFDRFVEMLKARGVEVPILHLSNSAGIMNFSKSYQMVRSGIVTYGLYPSDEVDPSLLCLKPALAWYSRIAHLKELPAGREISYGGTYVTTKPTRVATLSVGYADGYKRSLSGKFHVLIDGKPAPILGRVCMDQMMVDVTGIPGVTLDSRVVLIGRSEESRITMEEISETAGSFNYEMTVGIARRVPRYYKVGGEIVSSVHHLLQKETCHPD